MEVNICCTDNIYQRLKEIEYRIYNSAFSAILPSGFTYQIGFNIHKLSIIKGYRLTNTDGEDVKIVLTVYSNNTIRIDSNINLLGSTLIIF